MRSNGHGSSGKVYILPLMIIAAVVLVVVRFIWLILVNDHFDTLIDDYISVTKAYDTTNADDLKAKLLGDNIFMKMQVWNKEDLVDDKQLYDEMLLTRKKKQRQKEDGQGSLSTDLINL